MSALSSLGSYNLAVGPVTGSLPIKKGTSKEAELSYIKVAATALLIAVTGVALIALGFSTLGLGLAVLGAICLTFHTIKSLKSEIDIGVENARAENAPGVAQNTIEDDFFSGRETQIPFCESLELDGLHSE